MRLRKLLTILSRNPILFLSAGIVVYIIVFIGLSFWKYDNFLYNMLDLGIYSQVFESFRSGNHWYSSIQQSSYLGDHFEPFILALLPFYLMIPHPKTLLVLQVIFLALPAIPIFFIARIVFKNHALSIKYQELLPLGISFFYLLNPLVHNINLFEFHLLPFSLIFLFIASYFYIKKNQKSEIRDYGFFIFFCFLAVLVREDIPFIVFMFGTLALFDRRRWYWIAGPMILGVWWFILSMDIISAFNIEGSYKFLTYYSWIFQSSPAQFTIAFFGKLDNWTMIFGFFLAFLFVPMLKPRFLVLAFPSFLQFALIDGESGEIVWALHYAAYFLPALFLAGICGVRRLTDYSVNADFKNNKLAFILKDRGLLITVFVFANIGLIVFFGPLSNFFPYISADGKRSVNREETVVQRELIDMIPSRSSATLSSEFLPAHWKSRDDSALYWTSRGFKQFSSRQYIPLYSTEYALFGSDDIFLLKEYKGYDNRVRSFIEERRFFVQNYFDRFVLYSKKPTNKFLYQALDFLPGNVNIVNNDGSTGENNQIKLIAYARPESLQAKFSSSGQNLPIAFFSFFWEKLKDTERIYAINIIVRDQDGKIVADKKYPIGYGLYPASDWESGKIIQINQSILLPDDLKGEYKAYLRLIDVTDGSFTLDRIRSGVVIMPNDPADKEIFLGNIKVF